MLKIRELKFAFHQVALFEKLSFDLAPKEVLHLKGANGSGKSTLLSILAGLRTAQEGEISFFLNGRDVQDLRTCFAYLSAENNGLYLRMTARENLHFWSSLNEGTVDSKRIDSCLEYWQLSKAWIARTPIARFSTGMKRRLGLARIQLSKRLCFLLDEPLNGLDAEGLVLFQNMLRDHISENGSAILVSHEIQAIRPLLTKELSL